MVGEELLLPVGISLIAGIGRGIRGFVKHRKTDRAKFDPKKLLISLGGAAAFGAGIAILTSVFGVDSFSAEALMMQVALPWIGVDVAEDIIGAKKK